MSLAIDPPITRETELSTADIELMTDCPGSKTVTARVAVSGLDNPVDLILWTGAAYDSIGNWTQEQANARVLELIAETYGE